MSHPPIRCQRSDVRCACPDTTVKRTVAPPTDQVMRVVGVRRGVLKQRAWQRRSGSTPTRPGGLSMPSATEIRRSARQAGLLYLAMSILAMLGYFYVHRLFFVSGDPAATARHILASERLYRISILIDL